MSQLCKLGANQYFWPVFFGRSNVKRNHYSRIGFVSKFSYFSELG